MLGPLAESVQEVHGDGAGAYYGVSCADDDSGTFCPLRSVPFASLVDVSNVHDRGHDRDHDHGHDPSA